MKSIVFAGILLCTLLAACKHDTGDKPLAPASPATTDPRDAWIGNYASRSIESHPDGNMPPNTIIDTVYCQVSVQKAGGDSIRITTPSNASTVKFALQDTLPGSMFYHWQFKAGDSLYVGYSGGLSHFWSYAGKK